MWYLFEPRSRGYDDYSDGSQVDPSVNLSDILLFPIRLVLAIVLMYILLIIPFLGLTLYFFHDVYSTLKRTVSSGKLSYPFLAKAGVVLVIFLVGAFYSHPKNTPIHLSASLVLAIGFIIIFSILPLLALCLHLLLRFVSPLRRNQ